MANKTTTSDDIIQIQCLKCLKKYRIRYSDSVKVYQCKKCGHPIPVFPQRKIEKVKIEGLLYILCILLVIVNPVKTIMDVLYFLNTLSHIREVAPQYYNFFITDMTLMLLITLCGVLGGFLLWTVRPGALKISKSYLVISFFYTLYRIFYYFSNNLPQSLINNQGILLMSFMLFFYAFWYAYLERSDNVKNIYTRSIIS